jgi:hypothetical protein
MPGRRPLNRSILFLGAVLVAASSARAASFCTIQWGKLAIGTVERNPFTADVQVTSWQVSLDGKKKQLSPLILFHVARDGSGRVAIKGPLLYGGDSGEPYVPGGPKSPEKRGEPAFWQMIICDPIADTTTRYYHSAKSLNNRAWVDGRGSIPGLMHSYIFDRGRMTRDGRWVDLGYEGLGGLQAHGYRWWIEKNSDGAFLEEDFTEQWISDDLVSELSVVKMDRTHNREERTELTHVRRVEADPSMFQIPPGYEELKESTKPVAPAQ